jgi:beta-lactamase superfamily II metal-dependent hydrolase
MQGNVFGDIEGLAGDVHGLQQISDTQAQIMNNLGNTMDALRTAMNSPAAGAACQAAGERLHTNGMQFSAQFAEQSHKMNNNSTIMQTADHDNHTLFQGIINA